jgi:predicted DNA-binding transcriptional regulator YafY
VLFQSIQGHEWRGLVPLEEFPFTARKLLAYGPEVKVVSPEPLQQAVREMLEKSLSQYS